MEEPEITKETLGPRPESDTEAWEWVHTCAAIPRFKATRYGTAIRLECGEVVATDIWQITAQVGPYRYEETDWDNDDMYYRKVFSARGDTYCMAAQKLWDRLIGGRNNCPDTDPRPLEDEPE